MLRDKAISLSFELSLIQDAVEGARLLAYPHQEPGGGELDSDRVRVVAGVLASLAMVVARLGMLIAVVRGEADPQAVMAPHNVVPDDFEQPDILLHRWSPERRAQHAREVLQLAERRHRRGRR